MGMVLAVVSDILMGMVLALAIVLVGAVIGGLYVYFHYLDPLPPPSEEPEEPETPGPVIRITHVSSDQSDTGSTNQLERMFDR